MIYVLNYDGLPLMPTERYGKVRRMLNDGKALVVKRRPFTIKLLYETTNYTQNVTLGIDASNSIIGISASTKDKEVYASEVELRKDISLLNKQRKKLKYLRRKRNESRKSRPNKKKPSSKKIIFDYSKMPFKNSDKMSVCSNQKVQSHISTVNRITKILPVSKMIVETNQYRRKLVDYKKYNKNPYFQSNQREYVLCRDNHICQWCKGKNGDKVLTTMHVNEFPYILLEHYDSTSNMITLCKTCMNHIKDLRRKYMEMEKTGKKSKGKNYLTTMIAIRDISSKNNTRVLLYKKPKIGRMRYTVYEKLKELYKNVESTRSYITKRLRIEKGLEYSPINNARIMTGNDSNFLDNYYYIKLRRNHTRQIQKAIPSKNSGLRIKKSPYFTKGFASYDIVSYNGKEYFITKKRKTGYFGLGLADGTTLINSVKWDKLTLKQRRRSYSVETRTI